MGMNAFQTLLYVMIPQTFRNVLPTLTSEFILLYKVYVAARCRGRGRDRR